MILVYSHVIFGDSELSLQIAPGGGKMKDPGNVVEKINVVVMPFPIYSNIYFDEGN